MRLIFGLGNPGRDYTHTRHNVGFMVIDNISKKYKIHLNVYRFQALIGEGRIEEERVILAKPLTFVNEAGRSLYQIKEGYQIEPSKMIIISDDVDLKLGKLRIASKGGDGGHKGLRSIIESLQTREIPRLRVGIGSYRKSQSGDKGDDHSRNTRSNEGIQLKEENEYATRFMFDRSGSDRTYRGCFFGKKHP